MFTTTTVWPPSRKIKTRVQRLNKVTLHLPDADEYTDLQLARSDPDQYRPAHRQRFGGL